MHAPHAPCCLALLATLASTPIASSQSVYDGYMTEGDLRSALRELDRDSNCNAATIATTGEGNDVIALTLSANGNDADSYPGVLIVAGLDGRHLVGTETAIRVARAILDAHDDLLDDVTFYIVPRVNPDGAIANRDGVNAGHIGNMNPVDDDRDRAMGEDGPRDLNGDGVITQMRLADPPLHMGAPGLMADPVEPRLLKNANSLKGERAKYLVFTEGVDGDGDGTIAEDGPGYVDLDANFMHLYDEYATHSGKYQLSEPETLALARFVIERPNIVAAITYGRHDNLVNAPSGKGKGPAGQSPKDVDSADLDLYKEIGSVYADITGQERAAKEDLAGSFHAWLYAHRGVPSFASTVWGRPDPRKKETEENESSDDSKSNAPTQPSGGGGGPFGEWTGALDIPEMGAIDFTLTLEPAEDGMVEGMLSTEMFALPLSGSADGGEVKLTGSMGQGAGVSLNLSVDGDTASGSATGPDGESIDINAERSAPASNEAAAPAEAKKGKGKKKDKAADEEGAAWLAYSDEQREGAGFIEWTPFDHPDLGEVEIGGFVPGFRMNPPADELDDLASKQAEFIVKLASMRPEVSIIGPDVKALADGLYEVRFAIVNEGMLPTSTALARRARAVPPTVVRLSIEPNDIVTGDRVSRFWDIPGSGGRFEQRWIVRTAPGSDASIEIVSPMLRNQTITFTTN